MIYLILFVLALSAVPVRAEDEVITISTDNTQLVYKVDKKNKLRQCYFGEAMGPGSQLVQTTQHDAYPTFGTSYVNEPALRAVHAELASIGDGLIVGCRRWIIGYGNSKIRYKRLLL